MTTSRQTTPLRPRILRYTVAWILCFALNCMFLIAPAFPPTPQPLHLSLLLLACFFISTIVPLVIIGGFSRIRTLTLALFSLALTILLHLIILASP